MYQFVGVMLKRYGKTLLALIQIQDKHRSNLSYRMLSGFQEYSKKSDSRRGRQGFVEKGWGLEIAV
jgi:hypothetical protein